MIFITVVLVFFVVFFGIFFSFKLLEIASILASISERMAMLLEMCDKYYPAKEKPVADDGK
jgi:hypothetical protein